MIITIAVYALRFEKLNVCTEKELQEMISADLFFKLFENRDKFKLELDNRKFNLLRMEINDVLADSNYFIRVCELRKKFRYLSLKSPKKQTIVRQLSSCGDQKFNGFNTVSVEHGRKLRKKFKPTDMVYKPVKEPNEEIKCAAEAKSFSMDLQTNATTAINFLQDQISTNYTLNIALEFQASYTVLTIKIS